jgi:hypothetical protein
VIRSLIWGGGVSALLLLVCGVTSSLAASTPLSPDDLLPADAALQGWARAGEPLRFSQDSLWLHINGADRQFISYGCVSLTVANYTEIGSESEIGIEIYEMEDDLGSFGIYTLERPPLDAYLAIGAEGYQEGSSLNFFGDRYYVKLQAYPADSTELEAMRKLAESVAEDHLSGSAFPEDLDLFPTGDLVAGSYEMVPEGILGLKGLSRALVARYERDESEMTLYLIREKDVESAGAALASVRASLEKHGTAPVKKAKIGSTDGFRAEMRYHGPVLVLRSDADIVLAAGAVDERWASETVAALLNNPAPARY